MQMVSYGLLRQYIVHPTTSYGGYFRHNPLRHDQAGNADEATMATGALTDLTILHVSYYITRYPNSTDELHLVYQLSATTDAMEEDF